MFFSCLLLTIVVHECGHLLASLFYKVKVEVFSIGFGKVLLSKTINKIKFCISLIPLGGYIQLAGERTKVKNGFLAQPYSKKAVILLSGILFNIFLAAICYQLNYKNILLGFSVDLQVLYYCVTMQYELLNTLLLVVNPDILLLELSLLSISTAMFNLLPIPCLDGGQCIYIWIEKLFPFKTFVRIYDQLNAFGFWFLIWFQVYIFYWYWISR